MSDLFQGLGHDQRDFHGQQPISWDGLGLFLVVDDGCELYYPIYGGVIGKMAIPVNPPYGLNNYSYGSI